MKSCRKLQARAAKLLYCAFNASLALLRLGLWPRPRPRRARSVCIYRVGNIGDIVCALPAIHALRQAYPDSRLTLLTSPGRRGLPGAQELLGSSPWLDELFVYFADDLRSSRARLDFFRKLRRRRFDVWIELPNDLATYRTTLRNMLLARFAGARWAYGWRINTIRWAAQTQSDHLQFPNEVERLLAILADAGIRPGLAAFPLPLAEQHRRAIDSLLKEHGLLDSSPLAIAPGAKRSTNRWPLERFAEVGREMARRGFRVLLLGGELDQEACQQVAEQIGEGAYNLAGRSSLLACCELLKRCSLLICNDSGVQHLAAAVGTPCVSLFSFWQLRGKWRPYGPQHYVLQKWVECHTCFLDTCPYDNRCIKLISIDDVMASVDEKTNELSLRPSSGRHPSTREDQLRSPKVTKGKRQSPSERS